MVILFSKSKAKTHAPTFEIKMVLGNLGAMILTRRENSGGRKNAGTMRWVGSGIVKICHLPIQ